MQKQGIITPISQTPKDVRLSPYSSPCMILKKPGSETEVRLVSDVRELNKRLLPFPSTGHLKRRTIPNPNRQYATQFH